MVAPSAIRETQMTNDERLTALEESNARMVELIDRVVDLTVETRQLVLGTRRDSQQTLRIWIAFARHHGWPEDLENLDDEN